MARVPLGSTRNGKRAVQAAAISSDEDSDDNDLTWRFVSEQTNPQPRSPDEGAGPSGHGSSSWAFVDINDPRNKHVLDKLAEADEAERSAEAVRRARADKNAGTKARAKARRQQDAATATFAKYSDGPLPPSPPPSPLSDLPPMTAADEEMVRQLLADPEVGQRLHANVTDEMRAEGDSEEADLEMLRMLITDTSVVERLHVELALPTPTAAECEQRGWSVKAFERCCQDRCVRSCMRRRARDNPGQLDGWASRLKELDTSAAPSSSSSSASSGCTPPSRFGSTRPGISAWRARVKRRRGARAWRHFGEEGSGALLRIRTKNSPGPLSHDLPNARQHVSRTRHTTSHSSGC